MFYLSEYKLNGKFTVHKWGCGSNRLTLIASIQNRSVITQKPLKIRNSEQCDRKIAQICAIRKLLQKGGRGVISIYFPQTSLPPPPHTIESVIYHILEAGGGVNLAIAQNTRYQGVPNRVAAKKFVFVISRNFSFRVSQIFLEFREISQNTKSKYGRKFRIFAKHEIKMSTTFWSFCKKYDFLILKMQKNIFLWDTMFIKSEWILINFHLGQRKFFFLLTF